MWDSRLELIKSVYLYSLRRAGLWVGDFLVFVTWISLGNSLAHIGGGCSTLFYGSSGSLLSSLLVGWGAACRRRAISSIQIRLGIG